MVAMGDGSFKKIGELSRGDVVKTGEHELAKGPVTRVYQLDSDNVMRFRLGEIDRGPVAERELLVTGEHRLWSESRGWVAASEVETGEVLSGGQGSSLKVLAIEAVEGVHQVFTLDVEGDNAFYAGGVLVQDLCGGLYLPEALQEENK